MQPLLPGESSPARYAEPGYLLYLHGDGLMAQPFDIRTRRLSGSTQRIAESVYYGYASFSASSGALLYQRAFQSQLTWVDADGNKLGTVGSPGHRSPPYAADLRVFAVEFEIQGNSFVVGKSHQLFGGRTIGKLTGFDISPTNKCFLFALPVDEPNASPLILTTAALAH